MQDLTLVGMHDDGERLLLSTAGGDRFTLAVDEALRAAVRGDRSRLGQIQLETERMRPRDIQSRIRAGQTAEDVAKAGDVPLDYVRRYEGPVLAERAYVATQARRVQIRRGALAAATTPTLGDLVDERLRRREVDPEQSSWDAWRGDDGTWTVQLDFPVGAKQRQARWNYNPPLRQVTPLDDESRWLTDGDGRDREARQARTRRDDPASTTADAGRRLAVAPVPASRSGVDDTELAEEQDLLDALVETEPVAAPSLELLDTLRERRGRRVRPVHDDDEDAGPDPVESAIESILAMRRLDAEADADATDTEGAAAPATGSATPRGAAGASGRRSTGRAQTGRSTQPQPRGGTANGRNGSNHPAGKALAPNGKTGSRDDDPPTGGQPATPAPVVAGPRVPGPSSAGTAPRTGGSVRPAQRTPQRTVEPDAGPREPSVDEANAEAPSGSGADEQDGRPTRPVRTTTRKNRRASVPSWDEIILGSRRD